MIIDTHIHLDHKLYLDDLEDVLERAEAKGVGRFIIPGADPKDIGRAVGISEKYDHVYFAVGVHPYDMEGFDNLDFEKYICHPKCVAVGECGLDYYRLEGTPEEKELEKKRQKDVFAAQIDIAKKFAKPLIVHIRDASMDAKTLLLEHKAKEVGGVLHCYNANEQLLPLADENFYFGIGGVLTFKNAKKLVEVLPKIPQERLLVETDGPYLTPHPYRGKRNEPLYTIFVVEKMAQLLGLSIEKATEITTENALKLFNIK
ncbi:MAG: hydrolase TatD [Helicobacteraceae bacterium 4484_230]|nr:MAG: hydrolase TatD [Helicobacteraceae bacterium 4484_230]